MQAILTEIEGHVERHLEDQAIVDGYENPTAELLTKIHSTLSEEVVERKRVEEITQMCKNLETVLIANKTVTFSPAFRGHLADLTANPQHYQGVQFGHNHVVDGLDALLQRHRIAPAQRGANPVRIHFDEMQAEAVDPELLVDREGVEFNPHRIRQVIGHAHVGFHNVQAAMRANLSLRAMNWEEY